MGTTADKGEYLNTTKSLLKDKINNLGGDITSETTFREYAQELQDIYDNIPKTTGEDTNLSLTTLKGKMNIIPKGDTSQNGTPTPDTPIDIEVVTGTQEVKVENKNLLEIDTSTTSGTSNGITWVKNNDETYTLNGTATGDVTIITTSSLILRKVLKNGETYTLSGCPSGGLAPGGNTLYRLQIYAYGVVMNDTGNGATGIANIGETNPNVAIRVFSGTTCNNLVFKPQIEKGSTKTEFQPHQEQTQIVSLGDIELCKIGNYQDYLYKSGDKWYKKKHITNIILDNTQGYVFPNGSFNVRVNSTYINNAYTSSNQQIAPVLCNRAVGDTFDNVHTQNKMGIAVSLDGYIRLKFDNGDSSQTTWTQATVNNYLSANETIIYYVLKTPQDIQITNETLIEQLDNLEKLKSYNGVTNINCSGNLPMVLNVSALKGES